MISTQAEHAPETLSATEFDLGSGRYIPAYLTENAKLIALECENEVIREYLCNEPDRRNRAAVRGSVKVSGSFRHDSARCLQVQTEEGNIHAKSITEKILIVIAVIAAGAALFFLWQYYPSLKDFRQATDLSVCFSCRSLLSAPIQKTGPHYTFLDQNVSEVTLDGHQIRTMEIKTEWGNRYIQAVAVKTAFGKYYKFFDVSYDMLHFGYSVTNSGESSEFTRLAQLKGLQFEDGIAIQLISTEALLRQRRRRGTNNRVADAFLGFSC